MTHRVYFNSPPEQDQDTPELTSLARDPALMNHNEADLALVVRKPEGRAFRLLRDFGQTPLYYAPLPDGFAWSFSYRELLDFLDRTAPDATRPDEATLFDYLATHYRYVFRDPGRTFHQGVRQVPAGAYVDIDESGAGESYWLDLEPDPEAGRLGPDEAAEKLMDLLARSVDWRARAAVRPAFTISSGLDSAGVASLAARSLSRPLGVFSVGYNAPTEYDETDGVEELARANPDWRWTHLNLDRPDLAGETEKLVGLTRSPVITVTWLAYHLLARGLEDFREVFTGLGGDECLAGEYGHFLYFFADLKAAGDHERLGAEIEAWSRLHDHPIFRKNRTMAEAFWARNLDFKTGEMRVDMEVYESGAEFFNNDWFETFGRARPPMPRPYPGFLANRLYQEIVFETTPPTLWGFQRVNEALGLRGVSPFLSPALFKFGLSLPSGLRYDQGLTKALYRRGLKGLLPESMRTRSRKTGFNAPADLWFNEDKTRRLTRELLHDGPLARLGWLKKGAAERLLTEHRSGRANHMMRLWPLLNASLFLLTEPNP
ncbi:MAG: asparagine synthase C-terminal domain-containing protein [Candidatus Adiutrix sp.]|jgi:asparagine synthase (glutamine-hydrolysing)|nr:asparagine synthase C-terminal domain-containing protein [Candidatus Adiutrix sp.]